MKKFQNKFKSNFGKKRGGNKFSGGSSYGKGGYGDNKVAHKTSCAKCNNTCTVPFVPNGRKPVYCSDCFIPSADQGSFEKKRFSDRSGYDRKPSYERSSSHDRPKSGPSMKKEFEEMNMKLDRILSLLTKQKRIEVANTTIEVSDDDSILFE